MKTLLIQANIRDGRLLIDHPTDLPPGQIEVKVLVPEAPKMTGAELVEWLSSQPRLKWEGDPVEFQRRIRDEWPD